jgi:hypothetical protein
MTKYELTDRHIQQLFRRAKSFDELLGENNSKADQGRYQNTYNGLAMAISLLDLDDQYDDFLESAQ